ncbi:MAG: TIGR02444 family protein [Hyphomicrobiaceae bacterium]|nr:MAG: TIGR02444 family protein [Hyphomicrobiaceae bacterium]
MSNLDLDNAFWRFSLKVYAAPGVEAECLALQQAYDIDVNVLLFGAWLGAERRERLDATGLDRARSAVCAWQETVVKPLRSARRAIKAAAGSAEPAAGLLRPAVARAEIDAERIEQALLFAQAPAASPTASGSCQPSHAVRDNIGLILGSYSAGSTERTAFPQAIAAAALAVAAQR